MKEGDRHRARSRSLICRITTARTDRWVGSTTPTTASRQPPARSCASTRCASPRTPTAAVPRRPWASTRPTAVPRCSPATTAASRTVPIKTPLLHGSILEHDAVPSSSSGRAAACADRQRRAMERSSIRPWPSRRPMISTPWWPSTVPSSASRCVPHFLPMIYVIILQRHHHIHHIHHHHHIHHIHHHHCSCGSAGPETACREIRMGIQTKPRRATAFWACPVCGVGTSRVWRSAG